MYKVDEQNKCKKRIKIGIVLSIIFFTIMLGALIIIGVNVNDNNSTVLLIVSLVTMLVFGFLTIYFLIEYVYLSSIRYQLLRLINNAKRIMVTGKVLSFNKQVTTSKYQKSFLVNIKENENSGYTLYSEDLLNLKVDGIYEFVTYNNYIVSFEEVKQ